MKALMLAGTVLVLSQAACADVTIVSHVTQVSGARSLEWVTTAYVKGNFVRLEARGSDPVLYDVRARKVYLLDSTHKTYSVVPFGQLPPPPDTASKLAASFEGRAAPDVQIKPEAQKKVLTGVEATRVTVDATLKTNPLTGGQAWGASAGSVGSTGVGPSSGGGGFPGGLPIGGIGSGPDTDEPLTVRVQGEYWVSASLHVDGLADAEALLPWYAETLPTDRLTVPFLPQLTERMGTGFPLQSRVTIKVQPGDAEPMVMTTEVKSITPGDLDRSLFLPPDGYRQAYPVMDIH